MKIKRIDFFQLKIGRRIVDQSAWTGGDWPVKPTERSKVVRRLTSFLFREEMQVFIDGWDDIKTPTDVPKDVRNTFWTNAKTTAWRTISRTRGLSCLK